MNTCSTCKHFKPEGYHYMHQSRPSSRGCCMRWLTGYGDEYATMASNEVMVEDDEGWAMTMGQDFGCVLHEPNV